MNRLVPTLLFAIACTPNNATLVSGRYMTFISDGTSLSLAKEAVDPTDYPGYYQVDCREFETQEEEDATRLPDYIPICGANQWPPLYESWGTQAGFHVVTESLDPWRGEAVIMAEGDLNLSFHHRVPGGADMRFVFAIDPDFAPQTCVQNADGTTDRVALDGDWIDNWSSELDWIASDDNKYPEAYAHLEPYLDGRLYFLNARSYQYNPANTDGPDWDVPPEWTAGSAQGKFVEEDVYHRTSRYGDPQVYNAIELSGSTETQYIGIDPDDLFYCDMDEGADPTSDACMSSMDEKIRGINSDIHKELQRMMQPDKDADPVFEYAPIAHVNYWRPVDGRPAGFDGWGEIHYSYVVFSPDSDLTVGGHAKGAFSLALGADQSSTRMFVQGEFSVDKIKGDKWTTADLEHDKLEEAGETRCSAASPDDADPSGNGN
ncbi:MAG: hypothetical protein ABMA64_23150 [Myxococcota bacterium]